MSTEVTKSKSTPPPIDGKVGIAGRVVIPEPVRWLFDIDKGDILTFTVEDGRIIVEPKNE